MGKSGKSEFPMELNRQAIKEISELPIQVPLNALDMNQKELRALITIKALEEYLQAHACIPDFVVTLDE